MKAVKAFSSVVLLMLCIVSFSQSTAISPKTSVYYVQVPHTAEQCLKTFCGFIFMTPAECELKFTSRLWVRE